MSFGSSPVGSLRSPHRIWRIYILVVVSGVLLSAAFYAFGIRPLDNRVRELHAGRIERDFADMARAFDAMVSRHLDIAQQVASRTVIRQRQIDYLQGRVTLEELVDFSAAKLADAIKANAEIVGVARHDPDGRRLFAAGQAIPSDLVAGCLSAEEGRPRALSLLVGDRGRRFVYCSPIRDERYGLVGFDVVMTTDDAAQRLVDSQARDVIAYVLTRADGGVAFRPASADYDAMLAALRRSIETGSVPSGFIVRGVKTRVPGLSLSAVVDQARFLAPQREQIELLLLILTAAALTILGLTVVLLRPIIRSLLSEQHLIELASYDRLTGLLNWGTFHRVLDQEIARARRYSRPLSLIMFDIDFFKRVNDTYGHPVGDEVLRAIGETCSSLFRQTDTWARYGGEEFVAILPETREPYAESLANRLREHIAANPIVTAAGPLSVTVSAGTLTWYPVSGDVDKATMIAEVDKALYASKEAGRNRVTVAVLTTRTDTSPQD